MQEDELKQLPLLFRRGVVVPRSSNAEKQLRSFFAASDVDVSFMPISDDSFFGEIWDAGFFEKINQACNIIIDDYEEEILEPEQIDLAIAAIQDMKPKCSFSSNVERFNKQLVDLLREAQENKMPVFFVL